MKRYLPLGIILGVLVLAVAAVALLFHIRRPSQPKFALGKPGAQPPHMRGLASAPVALEEFGDFECLPCFLLWPILKNVEHDYGERLSVTFRQHPLPQHHHAREAALAAEAAGLQGRFWEMHDWLYQNRSVWVRALDVRPFFTSYASYLGLNVERFKKDIDGAEVTRRIADDEERGSSFKIDRTPVIFINGQLMPFSSSPEEDLRNGIDAALGVRKK